MKRNYLPGWASITWQKNKPFFFFIAGLLFILSILKIIFYQYNHHFIFNPAEVITWKDKINLIKWSLLNDFFTLLVVNAPLVVLLQAGRLVPAPVSSWLILPLFIVLNSFVVLLNLADIFYFPFHFQRASADMLFVLNHPLKQLFRLNAALIAFFILLTATAVILVRWLHKRLYTAFAAGRRCGMTTLLVLLGIASAFVYKNNIAKLLVPTYPLTSLNSKQLLVVQNSFHSFAYSLFRNGQEVAIKNYMPVAVCDALFPIRKTIVPSSPESAGKNIVLFIMESVPYDFFDAGGRYKVAMPFFDSILEKSIFFKNAFCYSHQSNKGITAILAGLPTLTDIPLYHSSFVNMPVTPIGSMLKKNNYHSFFCIGDDFDNFGFAKCAHWLGFDEYYCREDIPGNRLLPTHTMGIHDEFVLNFMEKKINGTSSPFFAVNYNISTHYPYDLPAGYNPGFPENYTLPMKSMSYYDQSLHKFFNAASKEPWFTNTVFIFCSDHWLLPDDTRSNYNAISGYRIPIIIYNPAVNEKKTETGMASQFDIMETILGIAGFKDSIISYGRNLSVQNNSNEAVFSRVNSSLYQVTDSSYVLGFNSSNDKAEFLYNYRSDSLLKKNLLTDTGAAPVLNMLMEKIKAFLQKATMQYNQAMFK